MNVINIKNGILLDYNRNYSIYEMYTDDGNQYYMSIANYDTNNYETIIDFPEEYFNSLLKEEKLNEIRKRCDTLYMNEDPYIYVLPQITINELSEVKENNDDHSYQVLLKRLQKYTYSVYKSITNGNNNIKINQVINIVTDTENDRKFIDWLDINLTGYFKAININHNKSNTEVNNNIEEQMNINNENIEIKTETRNKIRVLKPLDKMGFANIAYSVIVISISIIVSLLVAYLFKK